MKKEDALSEEFLKQFKTGEELYSFLSQIQKRGVEQILEGELDAHLGYEKHQGSTGENTRNGHSKKRGSVSDVMLIESVLGTKARGSCVSIKVPPLMPYALSLLPVRQDKEKWSYTLWKAELPL